MSDAPCIDFPKSISLKAVSVAEDALTPFKHATGPERSRGVELALRVNYGEIMEPDEAALKETSRITG